MPIGNGALTATAWANVSAGGVGVMLGHQAAQSSATELFKLGLLQVALTPNPFSAGHYFNQTLDVSTASIIVHAGGTSYADRAITCRIWVDANADALYVDVAARDGVTPYSLTADVASLRPSEVFSYAVEFGPCANVTSQPNVFVDPIPVPLPAATPAPRADEFSHASFSRLPRRRLVAAGGPLAPGTPTGFQPGSAIIYHRNEASDVLTVNVTLSQQGLGHLVATTPDHWQASGLRMSTPLLPRTTLSPGLAGQYLRVRAGRWRCRGPCARAHQPELAFECRTGPRLHAACNGAGRPDVLRRRVAR